MMICKQCGSLLIQWFLFGWFRCWRCPREINHECSGIPKSQLQDTLSSVYGFLEDIRPTAH